MSKFTPLLPCREFQCAFIRNLIQWDTMKPLVLDFDWTPVDTVYGHVLACQLKYEDFLKKRRGFIALVFRDGFEKTSISMPFANSRFDAVGQGCFSSGNIHCSPNSDDGEPSEWSATEVKALPTAGKIRLHQSQFVVE
jgi:hypothetical protein